MPAPAPPRPGRALFDVCPDNRLSPFAAMTAARRPRSATAEPRLPTLVAPRLSLRWMDAHDLDGLHGVFSDPDVVRFWSQGPWEGRDESAIHLESIERGFEVGDLFQWGIALRGTDQVIGTATLYGIDRAQGRADLGFGLAREHWGRRYAQEALTVLVDYAFGTLGLRRLEADVDPRNQGSLHTLEALGFRREGYLRQRWRVAGELQDSVVMGLLASEWPPAQ